MKIVSSALAFLSLVAVAFGSTPASAQTPQRDRPSDARPFQPNRFLLIGGGVLLAASHIPSIAVAASSDRDGDGWLYVPVLGPWADLLDREGCGDGCGGEALNKVLLVAGGITQFAGAAGVIASFIVPEEQTRFRIARDATAETKPNVMLSPLSVGRAGYGLGVVGRF